jgi:hypothetical protein
MPAERAGHPDDVIGKPVQPAEYALDAMATYAATRMARSACP